MTVLDLVHKIMEPNGIIIVFSIFEYDALLGSVAPVTIVSLKSRIIVLKRDVEISRNFHAQLICSGTI